jgi:hypothetical protein
MVERVRFNPKTSSKSITPTQARFALFGQPQLLEGEDAATYDELLGRFCAAVKPVDIIDEMFTVDMARLEWEVLRWGRLKLNLMRALQLEALKIFMNQVETDARSRKVEELVQEYMRHNADAVNEIQELLADAGLSMDALLANRLTDMPEYIDYIERIDRLASIAESRRNASLREIEQRRAVLGGVLRRAAQDVEDAEYKVIERRQLKGKDAA